MSRVLHFISGLPRAGSTLLANLMAQHPECHVTPTSACHETLFLLRNNWREWKEHQADPAAAAPHNLQRVLAAMLGAYHDTTKPVVIDKARSWLHSIEMLEFALSRQAKVIVPVRQISEILASFETLHRSNAHITNVPGDFLMSQTTEGRAQHWAGPQGELGIAYNRLKDVIDRGLGDRLHLVEFEALTADPETTLRGVWRFLEMDYPRHDFARVAQSTHENDAVHGYPGMHAIRPTVTPVALKGRQVLGAAVQQKYHNAEFWRR